MSTYPTVRPSLTLDFQKSKQLDPRISFSRASTATYVEGGVIKTADEHQARFEDDGLLIEESRTNTIVNSTNMPAIFTATEVTPTPNAGTAPDGTNTAVRLEASANATPHSYQCASGGGATRTYTVFAKADGETTVYLGNYFAVSQGFDFDLTDDSEPSGTVPGSITYSYTQKNLANGWKRLSYTIDPYAARFGFIVMPGGNNSNAGTGGAVLIWGPMSEDATFPTSYIPTTGSTVIRSEDIAQITGDNFSSWYNQSEGTVLSTFKSPVPEANSRYWLLISNGANSTADGYRFEMKRIIAATSTGANAWSSTGDWLSTGYTQNAENRTAFGYDRINNFNSFSNNGVIQETNTSATDVTVAPTTITIGATTAFNDFSGHISRIACYSERLTNEQLEAITS